MEKDGLRSLGELTALRTYCKEGELWEDVINRYVNFMIDTYPQLEDEIYAMSRCLHNKTIVPSMRLLQFAGEAAKKENFRAYNCAFVAPENFKDFGDLSYLLCCGTGLGVSVEKVYVDNLPAIPPSRRQLVIIPDSKEGWADSWIQLLENPTVEFDYSEIRPAGAPLSTGGTASGAGVLKEGHELIRKLLETDKRLTPRDVADICCIIGQTIVAGGVRRSALIMLYDQGDNEMRDFKAGSWWNDAPWRGKANISATAVVGTDKAREVIIQALESPWGEPGIMLKQGEAIDENQGVNPCGEISLRNRTACNLTEVICSNCKDAVEFYEACRAASFFGTLQAGLLKFNYIDKRWAERMREDALIGVSLTGQAQAQHLMTPSILIRGSQHVLEVNEETAKQIGINRAKRTTTVKPSGSTSCVFGTTSGIHAAHSEYVIRRIRVNKLSPLGVKLIDQHGLPKVDKVEDEYGNLVNLSRDKYSFIAQEAFNDHDIVLQFPCHYKNSIYRKDETGADLLNRMEVVYENWVFVGHREGLETNNVSLTLSVRPEEKPEILAWLERNQGSYRGVSVLPYDCGQYPLLPFEEVNAEEFNKYLKAFPVLRPEDLEISAVIENTTACGAGGCEVNKL